MQGLVSEYNTNSLGFFAPQLIFDLLLLRLAIYWGDRSFVHAASSLRTELPQAIRFNFLSAHFQSYSQSSYVQDVFL